MTMQRQVVRFGVRPDGFPLVEITTYLKVPDGRMGSVALPPWEGRWSVISQSNPLPGDVTVVDRASWVAAWTRWHTTLGVLVPPLPPVPLGTVPGPDGGV